MGLGCGGLSLGVEGVVHILVELLLMLMLLLLLWLELTRELGVVAALRQSVTTGRV